LAAHFPNLFVHPSFSGSSEEAVQCGQMNIATLALRAFGKNEPSRRGILPRWRKRQDAASTLECRDFISSARSNDLLLPRQGR
jgi:hypothetical protein